MSDVNYGAGTDPIGLDTGKFVLTDHDWNEDLDMQDIEDSDGYFLQGTARKLKQALNMQYWYKGTDWRVDTPEPGSDCSGFRLLARGMKRTNKGHAVVSIQVRRHKKVTVVDTSSEN